MCGVFVMSSWTRDWCYCYSREKGSWDAHDTNHTDPSNQRSFIRYLAGKWFLYQSFHKFIFYQWHSWLITQCYSTWTCDTENNFRLSQYWQTPLIGNLRDNQTISKTSMSYITLVVRALSYWYIKYRYKGIHCHDENKLSICVSINKAVALSCLIVTQYLPTKNHRFGHARFAVWCKTHRSWRFRKNAF